MRLRRHDEIQKKFYKFLRRLQLVLSLSLLSLFVWYSSGFSIFPQSFKSYFSMLTRSTLQRKYMFLIFNGILAFLAKTSMPTTSSPPISAFDFEFQASNLSETKEPVSPESVPLMVEEQQQQQLEQVEKQEEYYQEYDEDATLSLTEMEARENETCVVGKDKEDEEDGGTGIGVAVTPIASDDELVSTDELNRKFEEFIRKMKEEIRIEAQTQPIAA